MNRVFDYSIQPIIFSSIILIFMLFSSCSQTKVESHNSNISPIARCGLKPPVNQKLEDNEVLVIFELSTDDPKHVLMIWQDEEQVYECRNVQSDELTGEGEVIRLPVKVDGELFRFEIKGTNDHHELFMVPIPIIYPESPENTEYLAAVHHYSDENGWQVGMRSEPVYYE